MTKSIVLKLLVTSVVVMCILRSAQTALSDDLVASGFKDWQCKGAVQHVSINMKVGLKGQVLDTTESFKDVYEFFAAKAEISPEISEKLYNAQPGAGGGKDSFATVSKRADVHVATFIKRAEKYTISVTISRGANENLTHICLMAEPR